MEIATIWIKDDDGWGAACGPLRTMADVALAEWLARKMGFPFFIEWHDREI